MKTEPSSSSSSSSSASPPAKKFDVFLSFRGEDTRNNFTSHLSLDLRKIGLFNIFKDDYALNKGNDIDSELMQAIEDSQYAVVVLSENYATSSWCLKELAKIAECMGDSGRIRTIFYHVNPSHVRNVVSTDVKKQKESSFLKALKEHAKNPSHSRDLERWRKALVTVANQSGHTVEAHTNEASFIKYFVADISSKLGASIRTIEGLFGMVPRLLALDSYVLKYSASNDVCFVGIHGMGGIGKTTLAEAYHMKMSHKFDVAVFFQILEKFVKSKRMVLWICKRNFLRTFWEKILKYEKYRVGYLDHNEALKLFSLKAFNSFEPPEEFKELSKEVVKYTSNLPLALTVLGSLLRPKEKYLWESALCRLRKCPEKDIVGKLKISFDNLDEVDQFIFLDIACFFRGHHKNYAIKILDSCAFNSEYGISNLIAKSLLSITEDGTKEVEAIITNVDETKEYSFEALWSMKKLRILMIFGSELDFDDSVEPELSNNLRCLEWKGFPYNKFPSSFQPRKLVRLNLGCSNIKQLWNSFAMVPNLQILDLSCLELSEIDPSIKHLKSLIILNLEFCTSLKKLPEEIIGLASLQHLNIMIFSKVEKLPDNVEQLKNLRNLDIRLSGIKHLPSSVLWKTLNHDCNLTEPEAFPEYFGKLVRLWYLDLSKNSFSVLPPCIKGLSRPTILKLKHCKSLRCLEAELLPSSLQEVYVNDCTSLASFLDPLNPCHLSCSAYCLECTELVRRQDGKMTALASLSRFLQDYYRRFVNFEFVVPQSDYKLPSWFINQSPTPSNSIKLHPRRHIKLMGFAIVFCCFRANFPCDIILATDNGSWITIRVGVTGSGTSDHLFLLYKGNSKKNLKFLQSLSVINAHTFEFSFRNADEHCSSCGPWGARWVYEEDIKELEEITSKYNNDQSPHQKEVQSSHSQSNSQVCKLRHMGPIGSQLWTGLRGISDLEDNLELIEMQQYADEDGPNPESNPSMVGNVHVGVFRNYPRITTKFLGNLRGGGESE
ncbi:hypothetical protein FNV43_RR08386 [Rhamnella rubrinervis]|uniref:ADP-ribosyl cyclase/cyclic ADP-ribose hydrolase n=1 Tax=Rhamnella rubrinervis TaxID=2594499 RepID=A0A8K0MJ74_9ROSA|nr:hypothetical protein FNV43_RR08386 [Rhamnella rubrinervis]